MKPAFAALALLALTACSPGPSQPEAEPAAPPNVVVILADDLGYGDIGANGGTMIQTPHFDALARDGVRLTDGYVSAAVCSPSRAGLYTGRYQERLGFEFNVAGRDDRIGLPANERTIADMMKAAGYSTGLIGKWHQGKQKEYHPLSRGFDEYYGMLAGGSVYIDSRVQGVEAWPPERQPIGRTDANAIFDGFEKVDPPEYLTDVFARKAADFIDRHKDERFFLMLTPNTPHTPLQATAKYLDRYRHIEEPNKRIYAAMVASLDDMVGAVVAKLREHGLEENTLVVFFSDNGCAGYVHNACSNAPLNGFKRFHLDGGIRVAFIFKWPAGLPRGTTFEHPAISLDLFATLAAAAGSDATAQDSVNLLPHLRGESAEPPHEFLFWRAKPNMAVRWGKWKLWKVNKSILGKQDMTDTSSQRLPFQDWPDDSPHGQLTVLYDLSADVGEERNVAAENPEVVERLEVELAQWNAQLVDPLWPCKRSTLYTLEGQTVQLFF